MSAARFHETFIDRLSEVKSDSHEVQEKALQNLAFITKVSPPNRSLLAQTDGAISTLINLSKSSSSSIIETLSLSILFKLSLNPDLKRSLAEMETIFLLNSIIQSPSCQESSKLASSLICSLAMLDKNKAKFAAAATIQLLVKSVSKPSSPATHHTPQFFCRAGAFPWKLHFSQSGAVSVLLKLVGSTDGEDLAGTSLTILNLLARFDEVLNALRD